MNYRTISRAAAALAIVFITMSGHAKTIDQLMGEGRTLLNNGAYQQASVRFQTVVSRMPNNFEAQFNLGISHLNMDNPQLALTHFTKAVGIRPSSAEAWSNLGVAYKYTGNTQQAIDAFAKAVRLNPEKTTARINMANLYAEEGQVQSAIRQLENVLQRDPGNTTVLMDLAELMQQEGQPENAKAYLEQALNYDAQNAIAYYRLGNIYWEHYQKLEMAATQYRKAIEIRPDEAQFYYRLGMVLENLDKEDEALDVYANAISYVEDALKREQIQKRIDLIKKGEAGEAEVAAPDASALPDEIATIKREENRDTATYETIDVGDAADDITGDIDNMSADTSTNTDFDINNLMEESKRK
jgi:tetratricopeptide (TPR) repeat protein